MRLYDSNGEVVSFSTKEKVGEGIIYSNIYRVSEEECIKIFKSTSDELTLEILSLIRSLNLPGFYSIHDFYFDKNKDFKAYTMKYYQKEDIDILTMPTDYTLSNLYAIYNAIERLTDENVVVDDLHSGNVVLNRDGITVIDADLYYQLLNAERYKLECKNLLALIYLFKDLYFDSLDSFHGSCDTSIYMDSIRNLFDSYDPESIHKVYKKWSRYKYPIDYISKY